MPSKTHVQTTTISISSYMLMYRDKNRASETNRQTNSNAKQKKTIFTAPLSIHCKWSSSTPENDHLNNRFQYHHHHHLDSIGYNLHQHFIYHLRNQLLENHRNSYNNHHHSKYLVRLFYTFFVLVYGITKKVWSNYVIEWRLERAYTYIYIYSRLGEGLDGVIWC